MALRLFSSDLDGTLIGDPTAALAFSAAWKALPTAARPVLCYNTGRLLEDAIRAAHGAGLPDPDFVIAGVGTRIYDFARRTVLTDFDAELARGWDRAQAVAMVEDAFPGAKRQPDECQTEFKASWFVHEAPAAALAALQSAFDGHPGFDAIVTYSSDQDLDILPPAANKGNALSWLLRHQAISPDDTVVAGDTGNDSAMFAVPGVRSIAPSNARPELLGALPSANVYRSSRAIAAGVMDGLVHFGVLPAAPSHP